MKEQEAYLGIALKSFNPQGRHIYTDVSPTL